MGKDIESMNKKTRPVHNVNTRKNFSKIQNAIDNEDTIKGHTIRVDPGTYEENVRVNKELTIESTSGPEHTIVKGGDTWSYVFEVSADNVTIKGFTAYRATRDKTIGRGKETGIWLANANNCTISNNICNNHRFGIILWESNHNTISNNICNENEVGIDLDGAVSAASYNNISTNTCNQNEVGIMLNTASYNNISTNTCNQNRYCGILLRGSSTVWGLVTQNKNENNTISDNICNENKYGICLESPEDALLKKKGNASNTISNNICNENKYGICLQSPDDERYNNISNNVCSRNRYGKRYIRKLRKRDRP